MIVNYDPSKLLGKEEEQSIHTYLLLKSSQGFSKFNCCLLEHGENIFHISLFNLATAIGIFGAWSGMYTMLSSNTDILRGLS